MSLFEDLGGALNGIAAQLEGRKASEALEDALNRSNVGGLDGILARLRQSGLEAEVQSWLGSGSNMPVTPEQLRSVLSNAEVQKLAEHFGIPVDAVLRLLSEHLPNTVDQASPNGTLQTPSASQQK